MTNTKARHTDRTSPEVIDPCRPIIQYIFDRGKKTILEGCDGKHGPIYHQALQHEVPDTRPNWVRQVIHDDQPHVFTPKPGLKELGISTIHDIGDTVFNHGSRRSDPTTASAHVQARLKSLEEDIRLNTTCYRDPYNSHTTRLPLAFFKTFIRASRQFPPVRRRRLPRLR